MTFKPTDLDAQAPAPEQDEDLVDFIGARRFTPVAIPRTPYKGQMRLVARAEIATLKAEARKFLAGKGLPLDNALASGAEEWDNELAVRFLAIAVRHPTRPDIPLAALDEWRELDDDQLDALWREYNDWAAQIDPIGSKPDLTPEEVAGLSAAAKKGQLDLLMSFGSRKLALYATRSAVPPTN